MVNFSEEGRRRRQNNMVEIRKIIREENLFKKRCESLESDELHPSLQSPNIQLMVYT